MSYFLLIKVFNLTGKKIKVEWFMSDVEFSFSVFLLVSIKSDMTVVYCCNELLNKQSNYLNFLWLILFSFADLALKSVFEVVILQLWHNGIWLLSGPQIILSKTEVCCFYN